MGSTKFNFLDEDESSGISNDKKETKRYRCTQSNVTKALDEVTFSSEIKTEYLHKTENAFQSIELTDYIFQTFPKELSNSFQLTEPIEYIRNNIQFTQDINAKFKTILNYKEIENKWINFRDNELHKIPFFKELQKARGNAPEEFIKHANQEFSDINLFMNILDKNLFYHTLLKTNLNEKLEEYTFKQFSQIFPEQELLVPVKKHILKSENDIKTYRLVGTLDKDILEREKLVKLYNEIYKPVLKYSYSEFNYVYRISYTLDKNNDLIHARATLSEEIKNNFQSITQFEIKQVEV